MNRPSASLLAACACALAAAGFFAACHGDGNTPPAAPVYAFKAEAAAWKHFSGERAMADVATTVAFGPRPPGSEALEQTRQFIEKRLGEAGWVVQRQTFVDPTPVGDIAFANVRARFPSEGGGDTWARPIRAVVGGHYDTKLMPGIEFVGANDAGSSTGGLLEIARAAAQNPAFARQLEIVFFDGEEAFVSYTAEDGLFGSRHYTRMLRRMDAAQRPAFGIIIDMIADQDLNVTVPTNVDRGLAAGLFAAASELGTREYFTNYGREILDDHVPLAGAGLRVFNVIDMDFKPWHTAGDTMDSISAESLQIAGQAALLLIEKYAVAGEKPGA